jgi:hypothetical protein
MRRAGLALLVLLPAATARAEVEFFPEASVRLTAARYEPTETDLIWDGWIGAGAGLLRVDGYTAYGSADVETILGDTLRAFEANQANYHLQFGLRRAFAKWEIAAFFHHVSRHYVDRPKVQAVDWNVLAVGGTGVLHVGGNPLRIGASLGRTTQASLPGYEWEATATAEYTLRPASRAQPYARVSGRLVTVRDAATATSPTLDRGAFLDRAGEGGLRIARGRHAIELFVGAERRNDVLIEEPGARTRALLGLRIVAVTP